MKLPANIPGETPWIGKAILLVDLDAFFASVEQLDHPDWRGKPVIVGGDADKHGVVSTASYEARVFGVHSAMPSSRARTLCPQAIWTSGHFDRYREVSRAVMDILRDESPYLQQVSIDEAFLDVTPTRVNTEHPVGIARRIQERVADLGVTCSIGIGSSKTIAKIASDFDKPSGMTIIYPGQEIEFLSPLPIRTMSGVGERAEEALKAHGIDTLGDLAHASDRLLESIYGKNASMMRNRCFGLDASPVSSSNEVKSVSSETTFAVDLISYDDIHNACATMAAKVGRRLRAKELKGRTVSLKLRFADRSIRNAQVKLQVPTDNEHEIMVHAASLIKRVWSAPSRVRLVGIGVSDFREDAAPVQEALFDADLTDTVQDSDNDRAISSADRGDAILQRHARELASATDIVRNRFGEAAVYFGRDLHVKENTTGTAAKNPEDYA